MSEVFAPPVPQFEAPPTGGDQGNFNSAPQVSNIGPSQESQSQWVRSVARSARIRHATGAIIKTRGQFKAYLQTNGMDLYTSAVEFQHTGDFILSSYIVYSNYNNYKEPLGSFLQRYPTMQQLVMAIRDSLKPVKNDMSVVTPKLSQRGY